MDREYVLLPRATWPHQLGKWCVIKSFAFLAILCFCFNSSRRTRFIKDAALCTAPKFGCLLRREKTIAARNIQRGMPPWFDVVLTRKCSANLPSFRCNLKKLSSSSIFVLQPILMPQLTEVHTSAYSCLETEFSIIERSLSLFISLSQFQHCKRKQYAWLAKLLLVSSVSLLHYQNGFLWLQNRHFRSQLIRAWNVFCRETYPSSNNMLAQTREEAIEFMLQLYSAFRRSTSLNPPCCHSS